jgi:PKD repeat protein
VTSNISVLSGTNFNGTVVPVNAGGSTLAYDPQLSVVVMWLGCSTVCPDDETWEYGGNGWDNLTGSLPLSPSPRSFPGMDYDPLLKGVVLVGGFNSGGVGLSDTWLFTGTWANITSNVGTPKTVDQTPLTTGAGASSVAWDPAAVGVVLTDGCNDTTCTGSAWNVTDLLNGSGWHYVGPGPGAESGTELGFASMAYDAIDQYMVEFGGWDFQAKSPENWTFTYTSSGGWTNISGSASSCSAPCQGLPTARDGAAMTWDGQVGTILLVGGFNYQTVTFSNDSWQFAGGKWSPTVALHPRAPAAFVPVFAPALAPNSTGIAPFLVGGTFISNTYLFNSSAEWVWEIPPAPSVQSMLPYPVDAGASATFTVSYGPAAESGPVASASLAYGDGGSSFWGSQHVSASTSLTEASEHAYAVAGNYSAMVTEQDFFTVNGSGSPFSVAVNRDPIAQVVAPFYDPDAGVSVPLSANVTEGTPPYNYTWNFDDSTPAAYGQNVTHIYAQGGTYHPTVNVTDAGGGSAVGEIRGRNLTVNASVSATATATPSTVRTGQTISFVAQSGGGSGNYTYLWEFADGTKNSSKMDPTHVYEIVGSFHVRLWVNDSRGGSAAVSVMVNVSDNSTVRTMTSPNEELVGVVLLVFLATGVAVILLMLRRRRLPPTSTGTSLSTDQHPPPGAVGGSASPTGTPPPSMPP